MDRQYYNNLRKNPNGSPSTNYKFITDSVDFSYDLSKYIRNNFSINKASEWILGLDTYTRSIRGTYTGQFKHSIIEKGHIVEYDMFGNIGNEQDKIRPSIVLLVNGNNGIIVAPLASAAYKSGKHYHVSLERRKPDQGNLKNNCGIKLEQIRYIDKNRIIGKYGKVSNSDKLDEIEEKLTKNMASNLFSNYQAITQDNKQLSLQVRNLKESNGEKDSLIEELTNRIDLLEQKVKEQGVNN